MQHDIIVLVVRLNQLEIAAICIVQFPLIIDKSQNMEPLEPHALVQL